MARRTRRRRRRKVSDGAALTAAGGGFLAVATAVQVIREHPVIAGILTAVVLSAAGAWAYWRYTRARTLAEHERNVSITDDMTGTEFERQAARLQDALRAAGVKLTHQRLEIFREVLASREHPDAEAVYRGVKRRLPTVSLDTVYRTLALLGELGFVTTLGPRRESVRYDANLGHHHHFVCERCGLARDFESPEPK